MDTFSSKIATRQLPTTRNSALEERVSVALEILEQLTVVLGQVRLQKGGTYRKIEL